MYVFDMYYSLALIFAVCAAVLALNIGRSPVFWFLTGLAAGPLSLAVVLLPPVSKAGTGPAP